MPPTTGRPWKPSRNAPAKPSPTPPPPPNPPPHLLAFSSQRKMGGYVDREPGYGSGGTFESSMRDMSLGSSRQEPQNDFFADYNVSGGRYGR